MEKKNKIIWLSIITAGYLLVTRVRRVINNMAWRYAGLAVLASNNDTNSATIELDLQLRNSSSITFTLNSIVGELFVQGVKIGSVNQSINQVVPKRSISQIAILGDISWNGVAEAIKTNIMSGDVRNLNFQFVGYLEIEGKKIPINKLITFSELIA